MQESGNFTQGQNTRGFVRLVELLLYAIVLVHLMGNFLAMPFVRYSYLAMCGLIMLGVFVFKPQQIIWYFILFSLFEGQGRILWGYAPWSRIIFDITLVGVVLKSIIIKKKVWDKSRLPLYMNIFISFHFVWFMIELFNPNGAGVLASFATSKFYIFPFLLFFYYLNNPLDISDIKSQRKILFILLVLGSLAALTIIQDNNGEEFMRSMSANYGNLFKKFAVFEGYAFRPWGTSFLPGGMGTFYYMTVGFCFLFRPHLISRQFINVLILKAIKYLVLLLFLYSSFLGEVRSATLKVISIAASAMVFRFLGSGRKFRNVMGVATVAFIIFIGASNFNVDRYVADLDLYSAMNRWTSLAEEGVGAQRGGFDQALGWLSDKMESPLGYGLGMTTSFLPAFAARRRNIVGKQEHDFWNMDNFFVFLILELGVGAIFYMLIIFSSLLASLSMSFHAIKRRMMFEYSIITISASTILWVIVGNWGAAALAYNPESFFFWFWVALAFNEYRKHSNEVGDESEENDKEKKLSLEENVLE